MHITSFGCAVHENNEIKSLCKLRKWLNFFFHINITSMYELNNVQFLKIKQYVLVHTLTTPFSWSSTEPDGNSGKTDENNHRLYVFTHTVTSEVCNSDDGITHSIPPSLRARNSFVLRFICIETAYFKWIILRSNKQRRMLRWYDENERAYWERRAALPWSLIAAYSVPFSKWFYVFRYTYFKAMCESSVLSSFAMTGQPNIKVP